MYNQRRPAPVRCSITGEQSALSPNTRLSPGQKHRSHLVAAPTVLDGVGRDPFQDAVHLADSQESFRSEAENRPFTAVTGVRIPLGTPIKSIDYGANLKIALLRAGTGQAVPRTYAHPFAAWAPQRGASARMARSTRRTVCHSISHSMKPVTAARPPNGRAGSSRTGARTRTRTHKRVLLSTFGSGVRFAPDGRPIR